MTIPTKERAKCLNVVEEKATEELEAEPSVEEEKITKKQIVKLLFFFFVLISLLYTSVSVFNGIITGLETLSAHYRTVIAAVFALHFVVLFILYCFYRGAYAAFWAELAADSVVIFAPRKSWHARWTHIIRHMAPTVPYLVLNLVLQWTLLTLLFGPSTSTGLFKGLSKIENSTEKTYWNQTNKLIDSVYPGCFNYGQFTLLIVVMMFVNCYFEDRERKDEKPSRVVWLFRRTYGERDVGLLSMIFYFNFFTETVGMLLVLSGYMTQDFIHSLNWFSSLCFVVLPLYAVFLILSCALELLIYAIERCRNEEKQLLPVTENSPSIA